MKRKIFSILFALVLIASFSLVAAVPAAAVEGVWYVDCDVAVEGDGTSWEDAFDTIGEGIAAADTGDTVYVAAGDYGERITIDKGLTLLGANHGIHPAVGTHSTETVGTRVPETILSQPGTQVVKPYADGITIDGFKFTGEGYKTIYGYANSDNFHLTNCIFDTSESFESGGVIEFSPGSGYSHTDCVFDFNLFQDPGQSGFGGTIYTGGDFSGLRIAYNQFIVRGNSVVWTAINGVGVIIEGNEFNGTNEIAGWVGYGGFDISRGGNIVIRDNWFHDGHRGARVGIVGGSITGNTFEKIYAHDIELDDGWSGQVSTDVLIEDNTIIYNDVKAKHGIVIGDGTDGSTIHIHNNNFIDGGLYPDAYAIKYQGYEGDPKTVVDAENNWWGDASGPYIMSGVNSAGNVVGPVDFWNWLDEAYPDGEPTDNPGLVVGQSYNLYMKHGGLSGNVVYLDDIGNDALAPTDTDSVTDSNQYNNSNDAAFITLGTDGKGAFIDVSPLYATYTGVADTEDDQYIGIADAGCSTFLHWLEVVPGDISDTTSVAMSPTSLTYDTAADVTVTVTKVADGSPVAGAPVKLYLDDEGDGAIDISELKLSSSTGSDGKATFTGYDPVAAGLLVAVVTADTGGRFGAPELNDGIVDGSVEESVDINPIAITVTTEPAQLFVDFATNVTVTGECATDVDGLTVTLEGCGVTELGTMAITTPTDSTYTGSFPFTGVDADSTGTIDVTVSRDIGDDVPEFLGTASITVGEAEEVNVTVPEDWVIASYTHDGGDLDVTIQGNDALGPAGSNGNELDYVDIAVSGPNVSYSLAKAYWTGAAWALQSGAALPEGVGGDATAITFLIAPNMANEDVDVEVTGYTYDTTFTAVGTAIETVSVLGYALYNNYPTADVSVDPTETASLSLDVKTKDGQAENFATVTITASEDDAFGKDFDDSGEIEAGEKFKVITIGGNVITYVEAGETETCSINNGHYEVTDVTFIDVADVSIDVVDTGLAAFLDPAFSIKGIDVYEVLLDPDTVTAGVETEVAVTVTEAGEPVTAIDSIELDSTDVTPTTTTSATGEYTITVPATPEAGTPEVTVTGEDGQKYGSTDLVVALPTVDYIIYEEVEGEQVERDVMLVDHGYTVDVTVDDALGVPLDSYLWIGTYDEEGFHELTTTPVPAELVDGAAEFDIAADQLTQACSLFWMIGSDETLGVTQALVEEPFISVQSFSYDVNPTEATVDVATTYTVTDNYGDPAADRDIKIVTPAIETVPKTTGPAGTPLAGKFMYTAPAAGDYYVSVKLDDTTWQAPITVTVNGEAPPEDILAYYRGLGEDPNVVETTDLLQAANDWADEVVPSGFTDPISTTQLLTLANEWAATE